MNGVDGDVVASCFDFENVDSFDEGAVPAAFIALARNAFDVMMRRGWFPKRADISRKWFVLRLSDSFQHEELIGTGCADDPFTALVEADEWYKENVEGRPCKSEEPPLTLERRAQLILNWHQARMPAHDFKAMVLRHLKEIDDAWAKTLKDFARSEGITITFAPGSAEDPETVLAEANQPHKGKRGV
jgi:hypothetical protein